MNLRKCIPVTLLLILAMVFSGCSDFMYTFYMQKADLLVEEFIDEVNKDYVDALKKYSTKSIETYDFTTEQNEFVNKFSKCSVSLVSVEMDDDDFFDTATCKVKLNYLDASKVTENYTFATKEEYEEDFGDLKKSKETIKLKMVLEDRVWKFKDLNTLYEKVYKSYQDINLVGELGIPLNPDASYYESICETSLWYDPILSYPVDVTSVNDPVAIQCGFYFNTPVTNTFKAKLYQDGTELETIDINLDFTVLAICDFSTRLLGVDSMPSGKYEIKLYFGDELIASSPYMMTVN